MGVKMHFHFRNLNGTVLMQSLINYLMLAVHMRTNKFQQ